MADQVSMTRKGFISLMNELMHGRPSPEDFTPPGPWDPIIRKALDRIRWAPGRMPDPGSWVALNPQPLPPRFAFALAIAREMIEQVTSTYNASQPLRVGTSDERSPAAARLFQFVEDCGNGRIRRHWPWPPHGQEQETALSPNELIVIGMQFEDATFETADEALRREFGKAGAKLVEVGLARI